VTVTNVATNAKYEATTATDGGYTTKVPEATYHIEVKLRPGETLSTRPADTKINNRIATQAAISRNTTRFEILSRGRHSSPGIGDNTGSLTDMRRA
jgi:hypothetical protein